MVKQRLLKCIVLFMFWFCVLIPGGTEAKGVEDYRVRIDINFSKNKEENLIYPKVSVSFLDYKTAGGRTEEYEYKEQSFSPIGNYDLSSTRTDTGLQFQDSGATYTTKATGSLKGYGIYEGTLFTNTVWKEYELKDTESNEQRLYVFNYSTKELKLLRTETYQRKLIPPYITYFTSLDHQKIEDKHIDYNISGVEIGDFYIDTDIYTVKNHNTNVTSLIALSQNNSIMELKKNDAVIGVKDELLSQRQFEYFISNDSASVDESMLIVNRNGKYYEITNNHLIKEIQSEDRNWNQAQWKMRVGNQVFAERWISGWDYLIRIDPAGKAHKISDRNSFVREVQISPDNRYLASFEASYDTATYKYKDEQVRIYDIKNQKQIRIIKLPYRGEGPMEVRWHTNTILQYLPFTTNHPEYIRNVNVEILTGIVTKDLPGGSWFNKWDYVNSIADSDKYFTFASPLQILYKDKPVVYTKQPSFEGANGLVYCSVKDLATRLGAGIKVANGKITLTLNGKAAEVNTRAEDTIVYDGTAYAPVKPIALKLGLQYKRESASSGTIMLD
ncbi:WD40 repeat domain-containing protein [Paenibacillus typhae]|uniref:Copper amine oxidase N-terminal domain-containing protein n=1 Tax=Paenibacillus typhae TaxID=1174501 RepID=A0A1G8Y7F2_9BACL|nr:WD40 repeat domain-containing protein [Paenibacillus typhae]SDJ98651.1 hypothetical protein SAMN05216192_12864 [Paenibacillus typhae]